MKITALIASRTPELAQLAVDSLRTFTQHVRPIVINTGKHHFPIIGGMAVRLPTPIDGAVAHPMAIEYARKERLHAGSDLVMLMDDDCIITSYEWEKVVAEAFDDERMGVFGGLWLYDDAHQARYHGHVIPHAHCLVMRRDIFDTVISFAPMVRDAPALRGITGDLDTAGECGILAMNRGFKVRALPYRPVSAYNAIFKALRVQEYYLDLPVTLWAHVGRGTSWAHQGMVREGIRRITALWSPRSQKILRRRAAKEAYIVRAREHLLGLEAR